ncbi:MAG: hypothetical protein IKO19_04105 [Candidatus Riflebacteria bacterium]|nr:hypothetical protein [Candidatus Riflebacteria bacterium]
MSDTSDKKNKTSKKKESGFVALLKGMGCFFVCLFFFTIISVGAGIYFFVPIIRAVAAEEKLPEFEGPTEHDFWSLQEKTIGNKDSKDYNSLGLTSGEYNALLASVQIPPVSGFCLNRVRHSYKNKELRYYLIGSGYTFRKLVISFVVFKDGQHSFPSEIRVNNWKVPGDTLKEKYVKGIIGDVADADKSGLLKKIISGALNPFE